MRGSATRVPARSAMQRYGVPRCLARICPPLARQFTVRVQARGSDREMAPPGMLPKPAGAWRGLRRHEDGHHVATALPSLPG